MITWEISNTESRTTDGYITIAHWRCTASEGEYTATAYGTVGFDGDTPATPFDSVTEDQVIGWVKDSMQPDEVENNLLAQIEEQKTPATVSGTPWDQVSIAA